MRSFKIRTVLGFCSYSDVWDTCQNLQKCLISDRGFQNENRDIRKFEYIMQLSLEE
jgi:hypothetical protein